MDRRPPRLHLAQNLETFDTEPGAALADDVVCNEIESGSIRFYRADVPKPVLAVTGPAEDQS